MPQQVTTAVENNFTKGLVTEATGLNFPENAATDTDNCFYSHIGSVSRRYGIDFEENFESNTIDRGGMAESTYVWKNAGGDGNTQVYVTQIGETVYFWSITASTIAAPLSTQRLVSTVTLSNFTAVGATFDITKEATFADGNGYLFIYHPNCDPIYCTYVAGTIAGTRIDVQVRDFTGVIDGLSVNTRPSTLSVEHAYNLGNQGWTQGAAWTAVSASNWAVSTGSHSFTVDAGIVGITPGDAVVIYGTIPGGIGGGFTGYLGYGNVTAYVGTALTVNVVGINGAIAGGVATSTTFNPSNSGYLGTWNSEVGGYPSNADVWWYFKNASNVFNPGTTLDNVTLNTGNAPRGHFIVSAFNQQRDVVSAIEGITDVTTVKRPRIGAWFQGRVWYAGVDGSQAATGNANYTTWTESIYFSQIINEVTQLGNCYQTNDPTSETLFDLLPTDGGVIQIQGCGSINKLFPIQNGMLVHAANGVWFITGSQGIGFSANDYTITKISSVQSTSNTSFVDVEGLPYFWNEDGVYSVQPQQGGGLAVTSMSRETVDTFYADIPTESKIYARGAYNPVEKVIQWLYKDTVDTSVTDRYAFNKILNYNIQTKSFYPYSVDITSASMNGIDYFNTPGASSGIPPGFKYFVSYSTEGSFGITFADERDEDYVDWASVNPVDFESYFITGYRLRGQAVRKFQVQYLVVYSSTNDAASGYKVQGMWNYSNSGNSGKWSTVQLVTNGLGRFDTAIRRHKIRGSGYALQFKITSSSGVPFDLQGWAAVDTVNQGT